MQGLKHMETPFQNESNSESFPTGKNERTPPEMHLVEVGRKWSLSRPMTLVSEESRLFVSETSHAPGPKRFSIRLHAGPSAKDPIIAAANYKYPWWPSYGLKDVEGTAIAQWTDIEVETITKPGYDFMAGSRSMRWVLRADTRGNPSAPYTLIDRTVNVLLARFYYHSPMDRGKGKFVWDGPVNGVQETTAIIVMLWIFVRNRDYAPVHRRMANGTSIRHSDLVLMRQREHS